MKLLEKQKTRFLARDKNVRKAIKNNENKTDEQVILAEDCATYRWITEYLSSTVEEWEQDKLKREQNEQQSLFSWTRKTKEPRKLIQ